MQKVRHTRLNIYINDPKVRSEVKIRAAQADVSISEFCQRAITSYLEKGQDKTGTEKDTPLRLLSQGHVSSRTGSFRERGLKSVPPI